jgi:hypothetical protein
MAEMAEIVAEATEAAAAEEKAEGGEVAVEVVGSDGQAEAEADVKPKSLEKAMAAAESRKGGEAVGDGSTIMKVRAYTPRSHTGECREGSLHGKAGRALLPPAPPVCALRMHRATSFF